MTTETIRCRLSGLHYVYVVVPVEARVPIRGAEARFHRGTLGLSLQKWEVGRSVLY